jgi:predicted MFS family arabinose efflux permease
MDAAAWRLTLAAAALMALVAGGRAAFGLFVSPLNSASGIGLASFSLAMALGQLAVGVVQPLLGALVDRAGAARVIVCGAALLALATALPVGWPLPSVVALSVITGALAGSAVASNGLLIGEVGRAVPPARAGFAVGLVGAGTSLGLLVLGPATQWAIDHRGWTWALLATAALSLMAWPLAAPFRRAATPRPAQHVHPSQPVADVLRDGRFWRVALSFGVCGFHVCFIAAHMPGVIERCGLPTSLAGPWVAVNGAANLAGSVAVGWALKRHDAARLLAGLYAVRALGIAAFVVLPPSPALLLGFAVVMGASFMATLPPTSQLVARQHGVARLGTLFGFVMLVHQVGGFMGIAFGGWAAQATGNDRLLWGLDIALALAAMALVWPRAAGARPARQPLPAGAGR